MRWGVCAPGEPTGVMSGRSAAVMTIGSPGATAVALAEALDAGDAAVGLSDVPASVLEQAETTRAVIANAIAHVAGRPGRRADIPAVSRA